MCVRLNLFAFEIEIDEIRTSGVPFELLRVAVTLSTLSVSGIEGYVHF